MSAQLAMPIVQPPAKPASKLPELQPMTVIVARALEMSTDELQANFRPALPSDLPRVLELRRQQFGDAIHWDDAAYLTWRYRFGSDDHGRGDLWVLDRGSVLLGILGTEEIDVNGASGPCQALFLMDMLVREDTRGIAVGSWMKLAMLEKHDCIAMFDTDEASSAQFPERQTVLAYNYRLRCDTALRRRFDVPLLSSVIATFGNMALRVWRTLRLTADSSIRVKDVVHLAELASLFTERYGKGLVGRERTASFIEWRVVNNPRASFHMLVARRDHVPTAYLVVRESARELCLVDWFCAPTDKGASLRAVARAAIKLAVRKRLELVTASCLDAHSAAVLRRMGFSLNPREEKTFVYSVRPMHPIGRLEKRQWYLTALDGDGD